MTTLFWFRNDLRVEANDALALAATDDVVPVFVRDPYLAAAAPRNRALDACLAALADDTAGTLRVASGNPIDVIPVLATAVGATRVMASTATTPYGRRRDAAVAAALAARGVVWESVGGNYVHMPGTITTAAGHVPHVFTPFRRTWLTTNVSKPATADVGALSAFDARAPKSAAAVSRPIRSPGRFDPFPGVVPPFDTGSIAAHLSTFAQRSTQYGRDRDRVDLPATSRLAAHLHFGRLHPVQIIDALVSEVGMANDVFVSELVWREFHAHILVAYPSSAWVSVHDNGITPASVAAPGADPRFDAAAQRRFDAWCTGATGFPIVDGAMRMLRSTGWMHNRCRMVAASVLVKDFHLPWQWGARWFLDHLVDADLASNNLSWQWVAGTGFDAAPFHRVFNPFLQGERFDPDGTFVRASVTELASYPAPGGGVHRPNQALACAYPQPVVDHATARAAALVMHRAARTTTT